jgi:hypothetical protein
MEIREQIVESSDNDESSHLKLNIVGHEKNLIENESDDQVNFNVLLNNKSLFYDSEKSGLKKSIALEVDIVFDLEYEAFD